MDVTSAIAEIQGIWGTLPGVRSAPPEPTDKADPLPIAFTYEREGRVDVGMMYSGSFAPQECLIWSEIHIARANLHLAVRQAMKFRDLFLKALQVNPNLNGDVLIIKELTWAFGPMEWSGIDTVGYRFAIRCDLELTP